MIPVFRAIALPVLGVLLLVRTIALSVFRAVFVPTGGTCGVGGGRVVGVVAVVHDDDSPHVGQCAQNAPGLYQNPRISETFFKKPRRLKIRKQVSDFRLGEISFISALSLELFGIEKLSGDGRKPWKRRKGRRRKA